MKQALPILVATLSL